MYTQTHTLCFIACMLDSQTRTRRPSRFLGAMEMADGRRDRVDFSELPEECVAAVVVLTSPQDACRLSAVSSSLKSVADSDPVWSRFLPPDIDSILSRVSDDSSPPLRFSSLKQLYFSLCNSSILLDGGKMSFSLNRSNGLKSYMLSARVLSIAWGNNPMYWRWTSLLESRFPKVAKLISLCWFDISGRIDVRMLSPLTLYVAYLVYKSTPDTYGFIDEPVDVRVGLVDGEATEQTVYLDRGPELNQENVRSHHRHPWMLLGMPIGLPRQERGLEVPEDVSGDGRDRYPKEREDGWMEIELGEYLCDGVCDGEMEARVSEVKRLHWKSGLIIQGIEIRPKERN